MEFNDYWEIMNGTDDENTNYSKVNWEQVGVEFCTDTFLSHLLYIDREYLLPWWGLLAKSRSVVDSSWEEAGSLCFSESQRCLCTVPGSLAIAWFRAFSFPVWAWHCYDCLYFVILRGQLPKDWVLLLWAVSPSRFCFLQWFFVTWGLSRQQHLSLPCGQSPYI